MTTHRLHLGHVRIPLRMPCMSPPRSLSRYHSFSHLSKHSLQKRWPHSVSLSASAEVQTKHSRFLNQSSKHCRTSLFSLRLFFNLVSSSVFIVVRRSRRDVQCAIIVSRVVKSLSTMHSSWQLVLCWHDRKAKNPFDETSSYEDRCYVLVCILARRAKLVDEELTTFILAFVC